MQTQQILTGARRQQVTITYKDHWNGGPEWRVRFADGSEQAWDTAYHALRAVKAAAKAGNETMTVTVIEWCDVPDGWKPPTVED